MKQPEQNTTARRFQSFDIENVGPSYDAGYDCQLPPDARTELLQPRRARILGRPPQPPQRPSWLESVRSWFNAAILGLCGLFFLVALCAVVSWFSAKHERQPGQPIPSVHTAPVVQPAPTATDQVCFPLYQFPPRNIHGNRVEQPRGQQDLGNLVCLVEGAY
jgi:hypothetical protein